MATLQMQTQMTLKMILAVAERKNIQIEHRIEGADVAEIMLSLIDEETGRLCSIQNNNNTDDISDADDSTSSVVVPNLVNAPDPSTPTPSPATSHPSAIATSLPLPSLPAPCPSAPQPSSPTTAPSISTAPSVTKPYAKPASKNKRRHCSLCPFFGTHLQHHLRQQHSGSFTTNAEKMKLVHANDKLNTSKPARRFQCTYKSCGAIITWLGQHLARTHRITNAKLLAEVKAACIRIPNSSSASPAAPKPTP